MSNVLAHHRARTFRVAARLEHTADSPYRNDRVAWAHDCIRWKPGEGPTPYQEAILAALDEHHRVAVVAPHGVGKTAVDAWAILHFATTRDLELDDWKNPTTASAWRQLTHFLWPEVHKWARRLDWQKIGRAPFDRNELLKQNLKLRTGEAFAIASDNPSSLEGAHADSLFYLLDEARSISAETFDAVEGAFSGAGTDTGIEAFALVTSTPGEPLGRFYDIHARKKGLEDWYPIHVTLDDAIREGRISPDWATQRARLWGVASSIYKRRVLGEFAADDEDSIIPLAWVEKANDRWRDLHDDQGGWLPGALPHLTNVGVDVARSGPDRTVVAPVHRNVVDRLVCYRKAPTTKTTGAVVNYLKAGVYATVDADGIGAGVVDQLRDQNLLVIPFHAASKANRRDRTNLLEFINKRAAAWWNMREILDPDSGEDIALPPDDELLGELVAPKWRESMNGRIQVEEKSEVAKRLNRSPDKADAVVMAFWPERPVAPPGSPIDEARKGGRRGERALDDVGF